MDEQMAAWMKYAQPGEKHKFLESLAGTWEGHVKMWMQPGAPPTESSGTAVNELIMGGRYLKCEFNSEFMNAPFQGMSLDGFDNQKQKYVGVWIDSMGTMMLIFEGAADESGKVRTMISDYTDCMTGKPARMRGVTTIVSESEHGYEAWTTGPDGKEFKTMEITYTRR